MNDKKLSKGAHNLLIECARLKQSDTLLIIREKESLGWYKNDISDFILKYAQERGIHASLDEVGSPEINQDQNYYEKINKYSCVIFFARLGDQNRFEKKGFSTKRVMSYVRDCESLASIFGTLDYNLNVLVKNAIDRLIETSNVIKINCPLGTNLIGEITQDNSKTKEVFRLDLSNEKFDLWTKFNGIGTPDGGCLNERSNPIFAIWDGSCLQEYNRSGKKLNSVKLPVKRPTNCKYSKQHNCFFVTSASDGLLPATKSDLNGYLLKITL